MSGKITPELLIRAYASGVFPMAFPEAAHRILWLSPDPRAVIPLDVFRVPRSVRRVIRDGRFTTTADEDFDRIIRGCAARTETWISDEMIPVYVELHRRGLAHSIEVWSETQVVGGLYGVALGGAFFGESMFSGVADASKVALVDLLHRLRLGAFRLLDTQYLTPHLERFGAVEIDRNEFLSRLESALSVEPRWITHPGPLSDQEYIT